MRLRAASRHERGDTIVEVLIAMAVVSSVLGVTYATMNRNIVISRANQERSIASKLIQGQLEGLKALSNNTTGQQQLTNTATNSFCIINGSPVNVSNTLPGTLDTDGFTQYAGCNQDDIFYFVIKRDTADSNLYKIYTRWDRLGGGKEQIIMSYRI